MISKPTIPMELWVFNFWELRFRFGTELDLSIFAQTAVPGEYSRDSKVSLSFYESFAEAQLDTLLSRKRAPKG